SDDAALVEAAGGTVRVVDAPPDNLKVTSALDLRIAEALLREREGSVRARAGAEPSTAR
nr:2-C-methyl-D-erythritol 4-phosphate cytidylyltransferase [Thermoleophilaceae bacterium]